MRQPHAEPLLDSVPLGPRSLAIEIEVVRLNLEVGVEEPVDAERRVVQDAATDAAAVEVEKLIARPDLPGADSENRVPFFVIDEKRIPVGDDAIEHARLPVVRAMLT